MAGTVRIDLPKSAFFMRGPGVYLENILDLHILQNALDTLGLKRDSVRYLGSQGYAAVDTDNQINMVNYELVQKIWRICPPMRQALRGPSMRCQGLSLKR